MFLEQVSHVAQTFRLSGRSAALTPKAAERKKARSGLQNSGGGPPSRPRLSLSISDHLWNLEVSRARFGPVRQRLFLSECRHRFIRPEIRALVCRLHCMRRRFNIRGVELIELLDKLEDRVQLADEQAFLFLRNRKLSQLADILNFLNANFHGIDLT